MHTPARVPRQPAHKFLWQSISEARPVDQPVMGSARLRHGGRPLVLIQVFASIATLLAPAAAANPNCYGEAALRGDLAGI